jgi:hypothetical protein
MVNKNEMFDFFLRLLGSNRGNKPLNEEFKEVINDLIVKDKIELIGLLNVKKNKANKNYYAYVPKNTDVTEEDECLLFKLKERNRKTAS